DRRRRPRTPTAGAQPRGPPTPRLPPTDPEPANQPGPPIPSTDPADHRRAHRQRRDTRPVTRCPMTQQQPPKRIRVVLAGEGKPPRASGVRARQEIEDQTEVGEVLVRGLVRAQLGLSLRLALV